jgi:hypothetical protein
MPAITTSDILQLIGIVIATVAMVIVVAWRRRTHQEFIDKFSDEEICEHLRPALELLRSRGHRVRRAGQRDPQLPLEIHITPPFHPQKVCEELKLQAPVFVSQRNVLYCEVDMCELHPEQ